MKVMKKIICRLILIIILCLSLFGCIKKYDDIMFDFIYENDDGKFNAIRIESENGVEAVYFIDERYGLWINDKETVMFTINRTYHTHGGGDLIIAKFSALSYYKSIVEHNGQVITAFDPFGEWIFVGYANFSDKGTVATFSSDNITVNEMSTNSKQTVIMTKVNIPADEIVPIDVALENMHFVPDAYFEFLSDQSNSRFSCEMANLWIDGPTMTGEWTTNGTIIPISMKLHEKVPYVEIYDISGSSEKLILKSYANVVDNSTIELVTPEGEMFYTTPSAPVIIAKTN